VWVRYAWAMHVDTRTLLFLSVIAGLSSCKGKAEKPDKQEPSPEKANVEHSSPTPATAAVLTPVPSSFLSEEQRKSLTGTEALVTREYVEAFAATHTSLDWYGFYMAGRKVGFASVESRKTRGDEPGDYLMELNIEMSADGADMQFGEASYYESTFPFATVAIRSYEASATGRVEREYVPEGDATRVRQVIDGKPAADLWAPAICETLASALAATAPDVKTAKVGSVSRHCGFSDGELKQEVTETRVVSMGTRRIGGVEIQVVTTEERSSPGDPWIAAITTEHGTLLEASVGPALELKLEDMKVAKSDVVGIDIISASVKLDASLGDPSDIKKLQLRAVFVEGFEPPPSAPNQKAEKQADGSYLLTMESVPGALVDAEARAEALLSTADITANDPGILAMATDLTKDAKDVKEKVAILNHWVYSNLDKSLSTNLSTASQILEHKTGDCTEHTVLLLALLRSLKIPARELSGLVYMGPELSAFGWHAWTEVEIDGHWVQVDPSWDEVVGNATHIRLGVGDSDSGMMNLGSMTLEAI